jgi:hypothetical protein
MSDVNFDTRSCRFDFLVKVTAENEAVFPDFCWNDSVGIATDYGLDVWGSIAGKGKFFSSSRLPDRLREPTKVLFNGQWGRFSWG